MKLRLLIIFLIIVLLGGVAFILRKHFKVGTKQQIVMIDRSKIRIEIINCSGIDGQGTRTQDILRSVGFDVYEVRSGKRDVDKTTIVERVDPNLSNARAVSEAMVYYQKTKPLPIKTIKITPEVQKDIDSLLYLEVTVVLGKDCEKFLPKTKSIY